MLFFIRIIVQIERK